VEDTKQDKEEEHVVCYQNYKPYFIPCTKPINPTHPSTPLKIQKSTRAKMDKCQFKGIYYNCDDKYFLGHKCKEHTCFLWSSRRMFWKRMLKLPLSLSHLNPSDITPHFKTSRSRTGHFPKFSYWTSLLP
jgi:hypothetical protein